MCECVCARVCVCECVCECVRGVGWRVGGKVETGSFGVVSLFSVIHSFLALPPVA